MALHNRNCCVLGCASRKGKNSCLSFHKFPPLDKRIESKNSFGILEKVSQRKVWIKTLKLGKVVTDSMRVCSLHFTKEDFIPGSNKKKHTLVSTAIPTLNLPKQKHQIKKSFRKTIAVATLSNQYVANASILSSSKNPDVNEPSTTELVEIDYSSIPCTSSDNDYYQQISAAKALLELKKGKNKINCSTQEG